MEKIMVEGIKFERIRRVTGYLSGDVSRFNNGKRADYSQVDSLISSIPADLSNYTQESVNILETEVNEVNRDLESSKQPQVDAYATNIKNAIEALQYKDADYNLVEEAKAKVPSDLSIYTEESVKALQCIIY